MPAVRGNSVACFGCRTFDDSRHEDRSFDVQRNALSSDARTARIRHGERVGVNVETGWTLLMGSPLSIALDNRASPLGGAQFRVCLPPITTCVHEFDAPEMSRAR